MRLNIFKFGLKEKEMLLYICVLNRGLRMYGISRYAIYYLSLQEPSQSVYHL